MATRKKKNGAGDPSAAGTDGATTPSNVLGITIPRIDVRKMDVLLIGDSPLIMHKWSEKAKSEMRGKQMKLPKQAKKAKDPEQEYLETMYRLENGNYGFPCIAFKAAAVGACRFSDGVKMTEARGAFHIIGELTEITSADQPTMREDMVRIGMGTADLRYRAEFKNWRTTLRVEFNSAALSPEQIINLFNIAGFGVGVGEWRPERNGSHGRFHVATEAEGQ